MLWFHCQLNQISKMASLCDYRSNQLSDVTCSYRSLLSNKFIQITFKLTYGLKEATKIVENITSNLRLKEAQLSLNTIGNSKNKIYFVICNSCYWCATYFGFDNLEYLSASSSSHVLDCHVCKFHNTELMPISTDESFRIRYNVTRGIEIEFYRNNNIVVRHHSDGEFPMPKVPA